jgi:hypothetical protein
MLIIIIIIIIVIIIIIIIIVIIIIIIKWKTGIFRCSPWANLAKAEESNDGE